VQLLPTAGDVAESLPEESLVLAAADQGMSGEPSREAELSAVQLEPGGSAEEPSADRAQCSRCRSTGDTAESLPKELETADQQGTVTEAFRRQSSVQLLPNHGEDAAESLPADRAQCSAAELGRYHGGLPHTESVQCCRTAGDMLTGTFREQRLRIAAAEQPQGNRRCHGEPSEDRPRYSNFVGIQGTSNLQ
jgi:hypothetical protein